MNIHILNKKNIKIIKDSPVIVIDVLRAFTTACFVLANNPKDYIIFGNIKSAYKSKKKHQEYILIGERGGIKPKGFNYGNSPTEIKKIDFSGKTIIHTTTLGTKGIMHALKHASKIVAGCFVNASAIINYLKKEKPKNVYLFCTDNRSNDNEDVMFAKYIKSFFEDKPLNMKTIKKNLIKHESGINYLLHPKTKYSKRDFNLALGVNKFNFIIEAYVDRAKLVHFRKKYL